MRATAVGIILLLFSLYQLFIEEYVIGLYFIAISLPFFFIQRYCEINTSSKTLYKYIRVFGIPLGKRIQMLKPKGIKIVKSKTSQVVNSRVQTTNLSNVEYRSFIFFDDRRSFISTSSEKGDLIKDMNPIAHDLGIEIKS